MTGVCGPPIRVARPSRVFTIAYPSHPSANGFKPGSEGAGRAVRARARARALASASACPRVILCIEHMILYIILYHIVNIIYIIY